VSRPAPSRLLKKAHLLGPTCGGHPRAPAALRRTRQYASRLGGYPSVRMGDAALPLDCARGPESLDSARDPEPVEGPVEGHLDLFEQPGRRRVLQHPARRPGSCGVPWLRRASRCPAHPASLWTLQSQFHRPPRVAQRCRTPVETRGWRKCGGESAAEVPTGNARNIGTPPISRMAHGAQRGGAGGAAPMWCACLRLAGRVRVVRGVVAVFTFRPTRWSSGY